MCIGVHFMWNWIQAPVFGMGVSGSKFLRRSLFSYQPSEIDILGGADGLSVIIQGLFMIALTIFIWKSKLLIPSEYNKKLWSRYPAKMEQTQKVDTNTK